VNAAGAASFNVDFDFIATMGEKRKRKSDE